MMKQQDRTILERGKKKNWLKNKKGILVVFDSLYSG